MFFSSYDIWEMLLWTISVFYSEGNIHLKKKHKLFVPMKMRNEKMYTFSSYKTLNECNIHLRCFQEKNSLPRNSMANKLSTKMQSSRLAMWQKIEQDWGKGKVGECLLMEEKSLN